MDELCSPKREEPLGAQSTAEASGEQSTSRPPVEFYTCKQAEAGGVNVNLWGIGNQSTLHGGGVLSQYIS